VFCKLYNYFFCEPYRRKLEIMIDFEKLGGIVPAIAQDAETRQVLMMAWMNQEAFEETCRTGYATYYSRSRARLWRKGEESGHRQLVRDIRIDCDADTVLLLVEQTGAACHDGYRSCFYRSLQDNQFVVVDDRLVDPAKVYKSNES
jgi:phosphoribosyl-AMP cyclohydrolase